MVGNEVSITGMGLRYPGGSNDPGSFWKFLLDGKDGISEIPEDRWSISAHYSPLTGEAQKSISKWGGFITEPESFDYGFFGVSHAEAMHMDPQQRLLLQTAWRALEDSGEVISRKKTSPIGVFVGISTSDFSRMLNSPDEYRAASPFEATGSSVSISANRISHLLNLTGPSFAVDTACSSSLIAFHLACQSLERGECEIALVGGVNYIHSPDNWVAFSAPSMLSRDGRCKAFDASGDGFVRAEGAGVVVLEKTQRAKDRGKRIYAQVRGTAINQDGHTPSISLPNGESQEALARENLQKSGVDPGEIVYVEAHGTGTGVGDPAEANSLGSAYASKKRDGSLLVGSVKTNIGHLEAGSGVAGLIKAALILHHKVIPPNLHFKTPNPHIDFDGLGIDVPVASQDLPRNGNGSAVVAINSFGFGGSNANALLELPPEANAATENTSPETYFLPISAADEKSLRKLAGSYAQLVGENDAASVCASASAKRAVLQERAVVYGSSEAELTSHLQVLADPKNEVLPAGIARGAEMEEHAGPVFVFSGQGSQWAAMGRQLFETSGTFRKRIEACHEVIKGEGGFSLIDELTAQGEESRLNRTEFAQPAIFAIQAALTDWWIEHGVHPSAVVGHSVGEVAAARAAGALSFEDAVRVIFHRGDTMKKARGGKMIAVGMTAEEALAAIEPHGEALSVAAINGPGTVSISGDPEPLEELFQKCVEEDRFARYVPVEYAFHSAHMNPVEAPLLDALSGIKTQSAGSDAPKICSTVTGKMEKTSTFGANYWWRNVRETVAFSDAIKTLAEAGHRQFLEIGGHPVLKPSLSQCLASYAEGEKTSVLFSLRREEDEITNLHTNLAEHACVSGQTDFGPLTAKSDRWVDLPLYPWKKTPGLVKLSPNWKEWHRSPLTHPMLVRRNADAEAKWTFWPDFKSMRYLMDHQVGNRIIFPGAAYIEFALAAAREKFQKDEICVEEVEFHRMLLLHGGDRNPPALRISIDPNILEFRIESSADEEARDWVVHCTGHLRTTKKPDRTRYTSESYQVHSETVPGTVEQIEPAKLYKLFEEGDIQYGPAFRGITKAGKSGEMEAVGTVTLPEAAQVEHLPPYRIHPAMLDAAFQMILATLPADRKTQTPLLPAAVDRVRFYQSPAGSEIEVRAKLSEWAPNRIVADIVLSDPDGTELVSVEGFVCLSAERKATGLNGDYSCDLIFTEWDRQQSEAPVEGGEALPELARIPAKVAETVPGELKQLAACHRRNEQQRELLAVGKKLLPMFIDRAFSGIKLEEDDTFSVEELNFASKHRGLVEQYLEILETAGIVKSAREERWKLLKKFGETDLETEFSAAIGSLPGCAIELELAMVSAGALADVLRDEAKMADVLANPDCEHLLEQFQANSSTREAASFTMRRVVGEIVSACPDNGQMLSVLQIGKDGISTAFPAERCALTVVESSSEVSPRSGAIYDAVIVTKDMRTMRNSARVMQTIAAVLKPGGVFVFAEQIQSLNGADLFDNLTAKLLKGGDRPYLNEANWKAKLTEAGFGSISVLADSDDSDIHRYSTFTAIREAAPEAQTKRAAKKAKREKTSILLVAGNESLTSAFETAGLNVVSVAGEKDLTDRTLSKLGKHPEIETLVYAGACHVSDAMSEVQELKESQNWTSHLPGELLRALIERGDSPSLWFLTFGAYPVCGADNVQFAQAPLHGLTRVVAREHPELDIRGVDLPETPQKAEIKSLVSLLLGGEAEDKEIALRGGGIFFPKLRYRSANAAATAASLHGTPARLATSPTGRIENLGLQTFDPGEPGPGEVSIEVEAAGMNFRDVMKALKIYPTEMDDADLLGDEFAGFVGKVGPGVTEFKTGDRVTGVSMGTMRTHLNIAADTLIPLPDDMTFEEGASFIAAYLTANAALFQAGRLQKGERILIHSTAGGVGMAALHLALKAGAEVFATAGNDMKRNFLKMMGAHHVLDSHSLEFGGEIMELTNGEGIDMVLNSLAGDAIRVGLSCLRVGGRFIEIGKRDIFANRKIGLKPFKNGLTFVSIDLARDLGTGEGRKESSQRVANLLKEGFCRPLPLQTFSMSDPVEAFRFMARGKHIGKIVMRMDREQIRAVPGFESGLQVDAEKTCLITGGTSGFGLAISRWLMHKGARSIVLASRSGKGEEQEIADFQKEAEQLGAEVRIEAMDATKPAEVSRTLGMIRKEMKPVGVIVHAAAAYADEVFVKMTKEKFERALDPKMLGAWNLHSETQKDTIDHFVMISSMATCVGNPAQSNYVSANLFLEALAHHRRSQGLPGLAVGYDRLLDTGYVARDTRLGKHMDRLGWRGLTNEDALRGLELLLANKAVNAAVSNFDFRSSAPNDGHFGSSPRFSELIGDGESSEGGGRDVGQVRKKIFALAPEERPAHLEVFVRNQVARILRVETDNIQLEKPLNKQGMDSLLAVELLSALESRLGITVPAGNVVNAPTVRGIAGVLAKLLEQQQAGK